MKYLSDFSVVNYSDEMSVILLKAIKWCIANWENTLVLPLYNN